MSDNVTGRQTRAAFRSLGHAAASGNRATERTIDASLGTAMNTVVASGMAWLDLMARMQRASFGTLSVYSPGSGTRISASRPETEREAVVPLGEERLNVGTRTVLGETTRLRRRVVSTPMEQEVTLRDERVVVERRPVRDGEGSSSGGPKRADVLTETVIEMSDSRQFPQVWKTVHVTEEVVLRREITERNERVRETLRHDVLEVEHDQESRSPQVLADAVPANTLQGVGRALGEDGAEVARDLGKAEANATANTEALAQAAAEATRPRAEADLSAEERRRRENAGKEQSQPGRKN